MKLRTFRPFIKWAGGKSQLLSEIRKKYPHKINKYCEPFVGGGAVLFDILANFHPDEITINDINPQLINTYINVRDNVEHLIKNLSEIQEYYLHLKQDERKTFYYEKRKNFNNNINNNILNEEMAYLFIFLNKTCFNGLYRVNKNGLFNVPVGSYKSPVICDKEHLRKASELLQNVNITCGDYSETLDFIDENTFVYIDPPYRPLTPTASFTSYSNSIFSDNEQTELKKFIDNITGTGAKIIASNSDPKNTNADDNFFDELYKSYNILRIPASRMINSNGSKRGAINELLISNY